MNGKILEQTDIHVFPYLGSLITNHTAYMKDIAKDTVLAHQ